MLHMPSVSQLNNNFLSLAQAKCWKLCTSSTIYI